MRAIKRLSIVTAVLASSTALANAADLIPQPVHELPPEIVTQSSGGWYIRGDIGYAAMDVEGVRYFQGASLTGRFERHDLDSTWMIQGGIGYQATDYFRVDATLGYYGSSSFTGSSAPAGSPCNGVFPGNTCSYSDNTELDSITTLMANAYWDLGTYHGFTPYLGLGIGGAHVTWGDLTNDQTCTPADPLCDATDFIHPGEDQWRFAWAFHAGASYDIRCDWKVDAGYTYTQIEGGRMFGQAIGSGLVGTIGYDDAISIHTGSVGLRYQLGGCDTYHPPVANVVYK